MKALGWDCKGVEIDTNYVLQEIKSEVESALAKPMAYGP
jgi:hypothetical protein